MEIMQVAYLHYYTYIILLIVFALNYYAAVGLHDSHALPCRGPAVTDRLSFLSRAALCGSVIQSKL